jgi:hypothetical protein
MPTATINTNPNQGGSGMPNQYHSNKAWAISTEVRLESQAKRLDHLNAKVAVVLDAMRDGNALHLRFKRGGEEWRLTDGREVHASTAHLVINHPKVVSVGDALFADCPA